MVDNKFVKKYLVFFVAFLTFFATLSCSLLVGTVYAQTSLTHRGLTLSPLRSELNITPGTSLDGALTVTNSTDEPITVTFGAEEFSVINQQYDYAFTAESNLSKWVTFNQSEVKLLIGESKKIIFTVGVPISAEPGGRYISLFASTYTGKQDGGLSSRQRIASLLYITVLGDVTRAGHLVSLTSPWAIDDRSTWSAAIQNTGTTHFRSRYNVKLNNLFWGDTTANSLGDILILPGTVRSISDTLPVPQLPGIYKAVFAIGLGDTPAVTEIRYILYVSPLSIFTIIAIATLVGLWFWRKKSKKL